jgi:hypothetical protein
LYRNEVQVVWRLSDDGLAKAIFKLTRLIILVFTLPLLRKVLMKQTHGDGTKEKATVKFKMSDSEDNDNLSEASKAENRSVIYNSVETAKGFRLEDIQ